MTNRTTEIYGSVTNNGNPSTGFITATLNGTTVFSGTVPMSIGSPSILFNFEVDMALAGSIPMSITIENCDVYMSEILINYNNLGPVDPPTTPPTYISSGPTGFLGTSPTQDSRANVTCTGAAYCSPPPPDPRPEGAEGTWGWQVDTNGSTPAVFSYNLQIIAGIE